MADASLRITAELAACAPRLAITSGLLATDAASAVRDGASGRDELRNEGYAVLPGIRSAASCAQLEDAVGAVIAAGLPAVFVYVFDELWQLGAAVCARVSAMLDAPYELLEDAWAWRVPPGQRGWPPHRGDCRRVWSREAPELVTAWVALGDVTADRACMHVVPLHDDPRYPTDLDRVDVPADKARALPVGRGTALVWNANVLHWGGPCAPDAEGPRVSCSFSLGRRDGRAAHGVRPLVLSADFGAEARLDVIAGQIATYGHGQPDVSPEIEAWARATAALRAIGHERTPQRQ